MFDQAPSDVLEDLCNVCDGLEVRQVIASSVFASEELGPRPFFFFIYTK